MAIINLNQPIKVLAKFTDGNIRPCKFAYEGKVYEVEAVNGSYLSKKGRSSLYFFAVETKQSADIFELVFSFEDLSWYLKKVVSDDFT